MHKEAENIASAGNSKNSLKAGVAGAGGGTLFVAIADCLPETWSIKPVLVYLAPAFSVASSAFWLWALKLGVVLRQMEGYISNPLTTKRHRSRLIRRMEEIQISVLSKAMKEVEEMFH